MIDIAESPLFAGLSPVARARLIGELHERELAAGQVVFSRGDAGDALYVVREGVAEARAGEGQQGEYPVTIYEPGDSFGESALLTEEPRSTTVVALTNLRLWVLPKDRFLVLVEQTPGLALTVGRVVARRLQVTHQAVSSMHRAFDAVAEQAYAGLNPELQRFLHRTAPLDPLPTELAARALGRSDAGQVLAYLCARLPFVTEVERGCYRYHRLFRELLDDKLRAELGEDGRRDWLRHLADCALALGRSEQALTLLVRAEDFAAAEEMAAARGMKLLEAGDLDVFERFVAALPAPLDDATGALADLRAEALSRRGRDEEALALLEAASQAGPPSTARDDVRQLQRYRRLAELSFRLGRGEEGLRWLRRSGEESADGQQALDEMGALVSLPDHGGEREAPQRLRTFGLLAGLARASVDVGLLGGRGLSRPLGVGLAVALLAWFFLATPPAGLSLAAFHALGLLAAGLPLMVFSVLGDHLVALLMAVGWAALGLVPPRVALSGFATPGWFLVLSVLAVGAALTRVGLLYRVVLWLLARVPSNQVLLSLALAGAGILFSPAMPNATARTALAAPLTLEIADALGYARRSRGSAAVAMAVLLGFGQMCGLFLTGSSSGLLVYGVLPAESRLRFGWVNWFIAALPLHLMIFVITYVAALLILRPPKAATRPAELVEAQRQALGPLNRGEWIGAVIFVLLVLSFVLGPFWSVDPAWPAVLALVVLSATRVLDQQGLRSGVNWAFLIFFGVMLSLSEVFSTLKVDQWLAGIAAAPLAPLAAQPAIFLVAAALAAYLLNLVVRWQAACVLMTLVLVPAVAPLGVEPWVVGITALVTTNMWFFPYQSTIYQALYYGSNEQAFTHAQLRPLAFVYGAACLVGLVASVPFWRAMGLLP